MYVLWTWDCYSRLFGREGIMIYRVVLDDLYDLHTSDINCMLLNPSLELEMNSAGSFNFTLPPGHPYWNSIEILKSTIDVYEDDDLIFTGRVANIDKNWNNERVVECEGALAYFNDSIHRQMKWETPLPIASEDPTVHNFLKDILDNHNVFVGDAVNRQIHIGHIYVDPYLVTREVDYDTTLDILTRMCLDTNGGYFMIRKDPETHLLYLDWLKDFTEESGQPASFGVNLLNFNTGLHAEDICTGVLARGATVNDQVVTLSNVELVDETTYPDMSVDHYTNQYQDILWHREGKEKFGQVVQVHDFPDAQTDWKNGGQVVANSLFEEARKWLEEKNTKVESIEVEVAELSWLQEGVPKYKLGQIVEILDDAHMAGEPYDVRRLPMYKLSCDLNSGSKKVTLGRPPKKELTQISASNSDSSTLSSGNSSGSSSGGGSGSGEECKVHDVRVDGTSVVSNKIANINLAGKADVSTVNSLAATVATKADTSTVNALANVVSGKQDQIEFNTLEAATETLTRLKADNVVYNLGGGSANIDSGTVDPSDGNDGDLYLKISNTANPGIEDIFFKDNGTWLKDKFLKDGSSEYVGVVTPQQKYYYSERNSTSETSYTADSSMSAVAVSLSINGEASSYVQNCNINTTSWSNPNRNYAVTIDTLDLKTGNTVTFTNSGTGNYILRFRGIIGVDPRVRLKSEVSNIITSDNSNNSRTVQLSSEKMYMVLAFWFKGTGEAATTNSIITFPSGSINSKVSSNPTSVYFEYGFVTGASSVSIDFQSGTNYVSKGHIIYECTLEDIKNENLHAYSTSEQIVGTWIDGSNIYEKTYDLGSETLLNGATRLSSISIVGINKFFASEAIGNAYPQGTPIMAYNDGNNNLYVVPTTAINVRYVVLRYTKSS